MRHIIKDLIDELTNNSPCIIASIINSSGSAPRTSGARMLVKNDGTIVGSVGGGAVEGNCIASALEIIKHNSPDILKEFDLSPEDVASLGMVCGGAVSVLLQKGKRTDLELLTKLYADYKEGKQPVLLTHLPITKSEGRFTIINDEPETTKEKINFELQQQKLRVPFLFADDEMKIFVETMIHPGTVHLMGAGHVALATAKIAQFVNFDIVVVDDRTEFANETRYPMAKEVKVVENFDNCFTTLGLDDYVVIVTRGHMHDRDVLADALRTNAGYIGMIGSSKKLKAVYDTLFKEGFTQEDIDRVHSPIGLSIGADTPEEIAISIVAELIQTRAGR